MPRRVVLPVLVAVLGALAVVAGFVLLGGDAESSSSTAGRRDESMLVPRVELEMAVYLDLWERSRVGTYVAVGSERRWSVSQDRGSSEEELSRDVGYHHARDGDRSLVVTGRASLITESGISRSCELIDDVLGRPPELLCDSGSPVLTVDQERRSLESELVGRYRLYESTEEGCVELIGEGPVAFGRFGQSMLACFDAATGALVREEIFQGDRRRRLLVTVVEPDADEDDFDPLVVAPAVALAKVDG